MAGRRYKIQTLRGFEEEKQILAKLEVERRSGSDIERLINNAGGWDALEIPPEDAARYEKRDALAMKQAAARKARGERLPCPLMKFKAAFVPAPKKGWRDSIRVTARVLTPRGHWVEGGSLQSELHDGHFEVASADVPFRYLAVCPGIGTGLYEAAQALACKHGSTIAGSNLRSPFAQKFWQKQMDKGRARCGPKHATVFGYPLDSLIVALEQGTVTVPQYNDLVRTLPRKPPKGEWPCSTVPLLSCDTQTLRGVHKRHRSR